MKSKRIASAVLALLFSASLFAAGTPVFDIENWVYSILSYTQMGTDTLNFVTNVEREIEQAQKLYKALEEGNLLSAINGLNGYLTTMEKSMQRYGTLSVYGQQMSDIRQSGTAWLNHMDDPDYFLNLVTESRELGASMKSLEKEHKEESQQSKEEILSNDRNASDEMSQIAGSDSEMEKLAATYKMTVDNTLKQDKAVVDGSIEAEIETKQAELEALQKELEGMRLLAARASAEKTFESSFVGSVPAISIDVTDPYDS